MNLTLTAYQAQILDDRPEDCIHQIVWECMEEEGLTSLMSEEELWHAIGEVKWRVRAGFVNMEELTKVQKWILEDCYNGSTWYAHHEGFMGPSGGREALILANVTRSMVTLQRKLAAVGLNCPEPVLF